MRNPRDIKKVGPIETADYELPVYKITDEGIADAGTHWISFCKGNKADPAVYRGNGVFTESIIEVAKQYLESVNRGELAGRDTAMAITKLDEALMWLNKRAEDRKLRGVQGTYNK